MFVTNIHLVLKRKVKESFWHVLSLSSLGFCELIWILALSTFKKKSIFFLLKFQLICSYVFNFVLILYMYVPLVWCVDFINLCVFLFSKRITVFLIDFSLISFYIRPACPFSFAAFLFLGKLFLLSLNLLHQTLWPSSWREQQQHICYFEAVRKTRLLFSRIKAWSQPATERLLQQTAFHRSFYTM